MVEKTDITDYKVNKLLSVTGEWKIGKVGSVSSDGNDIKSIWGIHFSGEIDSAGLTGDKPPYGLIFTYGDPDIQQLTPLYKPSIQTKIKSPLNKSWVLIISFLQI